MKKRIKKLFRRITAPKIKYQAFDWDIEKECLKRSFSDALDLIMKEHDKIKRSK